jgi:SAM-dependent methyltransferase
MKENIFSLSDEFSIADIETIYNDVVLKQDFYGEDYGSNWSLPPFEDMTRILVGAIKPNRHLDIGCGEGLLVQAMRKAGIDSFGIDFSEALIKRADKSISQYVKVASVENWLDKGGVAEADLVSYMEVFEHLPIQILKGILSALKERLKGNLFLTIPCYGIDHRFNRELVVNDGTPEWKRDMAHNIPMRNIVLENGTPHLGHITLASYRWWTEFFMSMGFGRHYDLEKTIAVTYGDILACYRWNPYVLKQLTSGQFNLIQYPQHLIRGWHVLENAQDGRWTDGYAQVVIFGKAPKGIDIQITLPSINVIQDFPLWLMVEKLVTTDELQFKWLPVANAQTLTDCPRETRHAARVDFVDLEDQYSNNLSECWRITLSSPSWSPKSYGISSDERNLSIFVHLLEAV